MPPAPGFSTQTMNLSVLKGAYLAYPAFPAWSRARPEVLPLLPLLHSPFSHFPRTPGHWEGLNSIRSAEERRRIRLPENSERIERTL
jgi:hypothetical protein